MSEIATCPQCTRALRVPSELLGQRVKCPACATTFTAGGEGPPDEAPPPARREPAPERAPERAAPPYEDDRDERRPRRRDEEDEDDRPLRRRDEEEDYPRPSRPRYEDDEDYPRASRRRYEEGPLRRRDKPGKVQAIAIMALVGGIWAVLHALGTFGGSRGACCFWPGTYYCLVSGILAIIKGSQLLGEGSRLQAVPMVTGVLLIINIVGLDVVNCVLGILIVVFCNDPEVRSYFRA